MHRLSYVLLSYIRLIFYTEEVEAMAQVAVQFTIRLHRSVEVNGQPCATPRAGGTPLIWRLRDFGSPNILAPS